MHIDHVGRISYLLAGGLEGPIVCSETSAELLAMVNEDALEVGFTRDRTLIQRAIAQLHKQIVPLPYKHRLLLGKAETRTTSLKVWLSPAGQILGSARVEPR